MALKLYNTLTRQKAEFKPIDDKNVRMYVCGPTVYDYAHIGNARPVIVFDVLFRLLRHIYGKEHVTYVRNITDVDDKINARAARDYPGLPLNEAIRKVTEATAEQFKADVKALGCDKPSREPRATEHIDEMVAIIQELLDKGHAYIAVGNEGREVLFDISSMPDYGELSHRSIDEQQAGARVDVEAHKKNPGDFVLWKESDAQTPGWTAEFRIDAAHPANISAVAIFGRPGWHIECSAMSDYWLWSEPKAASKLSAEALRRPHVFDIHGGGLDLIFPHHENEIAQSRCAHGSPVMANVWMHNGFLQVEGEKMSKSLGNFVTINELLTTDKFGDRSWPGDVLRLAMLMTHYREPIDFSVKRLEEAQAILNRWSDMAFGISTAGLSAQFPAANPLLDDLNTPQFITQMHSLYKSAKSGDENALVSFRLGLEILGFGDISVAAHKLRRIDVKADDRIADLIADRLEARKRKDFAESDRIRDELAKMGITLKDSKNKETGEIETTWDVAR